MPFEFQKTQIPDVIIVTPKVFGDERGFFMESYKKSDFEQNGIWGEFNQDNHSKSSKGVLRGLHFQKEYTQTKLVRCVRGAVYDVAVDLRKGSETYGKYYGVTLSEENHLEFLIPKGFAHGFVVLTDTAEFVYKVDDFYHPNDEGGIAYNDPDIGIDWPFDEIGGEENLNINDRDRNWPRLKDQTDLKF